MHRREKYVFLSGNGYSAISLTVQRYRSVVRLTFVTEYKNEWGHAAGGAVGCGTALRAGRSQVRFPMVSLEFFIHIILPAALWPWG
jgi:hypothetical protein